MLASEEFLRRRGVTIEPRWVRECFPAQRAFVCDESKNVAALCSRRAGKSHGKARRLLRAAERHPGEMSLYVAKTKNNARMIVGKALTEVSRLHGLGLVLKEVDQRLMCVHPNGHHIWLAGAKHREAFEDFRGYKFAEVQVDEAQLYGAYLQGVIEEVLEPCTGDLDGAIVLSGTPSPLPIGFFHAVTTGLDTDAEGGSIPKWPTHHWTMAENLYFRGGRGDDYREAIRVKRNWQLDHPRYVREYLGQWVHDAESLVYPYDAKRNAWTDPLPEGAWIYVLAVDLGASKLERTTSFTLLGYRRDYPEVFILKSYKRAGMIPTRIAAEIARIRADYRLSHIVVDHGGLGIGYIAELNELHGIPAEPVENKSKLAFVEFLRGDLLSGTVKVIPSECRDLLDEWALVQWKEDRTGIDERFEDHASDGALYGHRACKAYYRPTEEGPKPGTPEAVNLEMRRHKAAEQKKLREQQRKRLSR